MEFEFDYAKDAINLAQHGVSLAFGEQVMDDADGVLIQTYRLIDEEFRYKAVGLVDGRLWTAVHVMRGGVVRFISVRKNNDGEQRSYHRA